MWFSSKDEQHFGEYQAGGHEWRVDQVARQAATAIEICTVPIYSSVPFTVRTEITCANQFTLTTSNVFY
jgi:hypothetical protein